jgi:hypothetical protein
MIRYMIFWFVATYLPIFAPLAVSAYRVVIQ